MDEPGGSKDQKQPSDRVDLDLLAIGKKMGLSFAEINELRASDLLAFTYAYTGEERPRMATQADIDRFFSR